MKYRGILYFFLMVFYSINAIGNDLNIPKPLNANDENLYRIFGTSYDKLMTMKKSQPFDFDLPSEISMLYCPLVINYGLFKIGALKTDWLPSRYVFVGSKDWGKNIGHNHKTFKKLHKDYI